MLDVELMSYQGGSTCEMLGVIGEVFSNALPVDSDLQKYIFISQRYAPFHISVRGPGFNGNARSNKQSDGILRFRTMI